MCTYVHAHMHVCVHTCVRAASFCPVSFPSISFPSVWYCSLDPWLQYAEEAFAHVEELRRDDSPGEVDNNTVQNKILVARARIKARLANKKNCQGLTSEAEDEKATGTGLSHKRITGSLMI